MSYLKKLKELIGEDAFKKVETDLKGKELYDLDPKEYIPKETFNAKLEEIKTLKSDREKAEKDLKTAQTELKTLKDEKGKGDKTLEQKVADLEKQVQDQGNKLTSKDKELSLAKKESVLKEALTNAGVKNPKNLKLLMKEFDLEKLEMEENGEKIKGFDDSVKKLQEDYKPLFGEDSFSGTPPGKSKKEGEEEKEMSTQEFFENEVFGAKK